MVYIYVWRISYLFGKISKAQSRSKLFVMFRLSISWIRNSIKLTVWKQVICILIIFFKYVLFVSEENCFRNEVLRLILTKSICNGCLVWHCNCNYHVGDKVVSPVSGVASTGVMGAECPPCKQKICQKIRKKSIKRGKIREKWKKSGRKGKNWAGSFTLPILTDRAGYVTE